jgi:hypothetical protein
MREEAPLYVAAMAAQTNVSSALLLVQIPCTGLASLLSASEDELRCRLWGKSEIGRCLAQNCLDAFQNPAAAAAMMS